jgi:sialic acid synthase SpsE
MSNGGAMTAAHRQARYRERVKQDQASLVQRANAKSTLCAAVRHAADAGVELAATVMGSDDVKILDNLTVHFFKAAKSRRPVKSRARKAKGGV